MEVNKKMLLVIITMMCSIGLIATDIYIPAMPQIANYFNVGSHSLQMTLSIYLLGLAISQLIYGILTERFGRKVIVLIGCIIFFIASVTCAFTTSITMLIVARLFQAIGAGAGMTIGRAIIADLYTKTESAKIFATIFPIIGLSPAIAPVIGGLISNYSSWRFVFGLIAVISLILVSLIVSSLPETKKDENKISIHPKSIIKNYGHLVSQKIFWQYVLVPAFAYIVYFAYIAESPFIFHTFSYSASQIGFFYISISLSYLVGNFIAKKLTRSFSINQLITIGYGCFIFGGLLMVCMNSWLEPSIASLIIPATVLTLGNGFLLPMGTAGLVNQFPKISGYASGLLGVFQLAAAAASANFVGLVTQGNSILLSWFIAIATIVGGLLFALLGYSSGATGIPTTNHAAIGYGRDRHSEKLTH